MGNGKLDSGHVVLPIYNPASGGIHSVAVPHDTDLASLHSSLMDAGYENPTIASQMSQPTAEGAIENSPEFKRAAQDAWVRAGNGTKDIESGALIQKNGRALDIPTNNRISHLNLPVNSNTFGTIHTHPNSKDTKPSDDDIRAAQSNKMPFYVVSKGGLMMVDVDGQIYQTYKAPGDVFDKKKRAKLHLVKR